jgi:hypothetical protein
MKNEDFHVKKVNPKDFTTAEIMGWECDMFWKLQTLELKPLPFPLDKIYAKVAKANVLPGGRSIYDEAEDSSRKALDAVIEGHDRPIPHLHATISRANAEIAIARKLKDAEGGEMDELIKKRAVAMFCEKASSTLPTESFKCLEAARFVALRYWEYELCNDENGHRREYGNWLYCTEQEMKKVDDAIALAILDAQ